MKNNPKIALSCLGIVLALTCGSLFFNYAYSQVPPSFLSLPSSSMVDHGVNVTVNDPNILSGTQSIPVLVQGSDPLPTTVTLVHTPNLSENTFMGFIYFKNHNYDKSSLLSPAIMVSDSYPSNVIISYTSGTTISTTVQIIDSTQNTATPSPKAPFVYNFPCTGIWGTDNGDGVCSAWKTSTGLKIPFKNDTSKFYRYDCVNSAGAQVHPFDSQGAHDVGNATYDGQCPSTNQRDVYLELDYMMGHQPDPVRLEHVIQALKADGIVLHIQLDDDLKLYHRDTSSAPAAGGAGGTDFDALKRNYFGVNSDRVSSSCEHATGVYANYNMCTTSKRYVFHYAIFSHAQTSSTSSGYSEMPGNDMEISLGDFTGGTGTNDQIEGALMHELGHNFGLDHGGNEAKNCKPNYPSVMSYTLWDKTINPSRALDYSHGSLATLDETHLDESKGTGSVTGIQLGWGYTDANNNWYPANGQSGRTMDWNNNGVTTEPQYGLMISNIPSVQANACVSTTPDTNMADFNDVNFIDTNSIKFRSNSAYSDTYRIWFPNNAVINLHKEPSDWFKQWVHDFGLQKMHPYKIYSNSTELTADDLKQLRIDKVKSLKHAIDNDSTLSGNKTTLDNYAQNAADSTSKGDIANTLVLLEKIGKEYTHEGGHSDYVSNMLTDLKISHARGNSQGSHGYPHP